MGISHPFPAQVSVSAQRSFERYTIEGYGHTMIPRRSGRYRERLVTWKPVGRVRDWIQDFFLGGAHRLADLRYAAHPPDEWHAHPDQRHDHSPFLSKFGFMTERSGAVDVEFFVSEIKPPEKQKRPENADDAATARNRDDRLKSRSASARARLGRLDAILADYRAKLKIGSDYSADDFDKDRDKSAAQRAQDLIRKLEEERKQAKAANAARLDKVRKEARMAQRLNDADGERSRDDDDDDDAAADANGSRGRDDAAVRNPLKRRPKVVGAKLKPDDDDDAAEKPKETVFDFSKTKDFGGVEVVTPGGEKVIDFSGARPDAAAAVDLLTGDAGVEEAKGDDSGVEESKRT